LSRYDDHKDVLSPDASEASVCHPDASEASGGSLWRDSDPSLRSG
jgi:hypothetical protein